MKKYIKAISVLLCFLLLTVFVYATATTANTRKSIKLPWQGTPSLHYDSAHNVWTSNSAESRFTCISGTCNSTQSNNGVVSDSVTGLQWQSWYPGATYTWQWAKDYCTGLALDGWAWRLPTFKELESIVDFSRSSPIINTSYFSSATSYYWSSTTYAPNTANAWIVNFYTDGSNYNPNTNNYYVRCTR